MIDVRFDNLEEVSRYYDPIIVEKAASSAIKKLQGKAATATSKEVRRVYNVRARDITKTLKKRIVTQNGIPVALLIYTSKRLSLRYFSSYKGGVPSQNARPKVRTRAGVRRGARVRIKKTSRAVVLKQAFWGKGRAGFEDGGGEWQIFQRIGLSRLGVKKLTGPSISHMIRNDNAQDAINKLLANDATRTLQHELDHFLQRRIGLR